MCEDTDDFRVRAEYVHQGSVLVPCLFSVVMDEFSNEIKNGFHDVC